jgi:hypothetical protein
VKVEIGKDLSSVFVLHDDTGEVTEEQTDDDIRAFEGNDCGR